MAWQNEQLQPEYSIGHSLYMIATWYAPIDYYYHWMEEKQISRYYDAQFCRISHKLGKINILHKIDNDIII